MRRVIFIILINCCIMIRSGEAREITEKWITANYSKTEVMIPMRDGVSLYTAIYSPVGDGMKRPVIIQRSPYALRPYGKGYAKALREYFYMFMKHKYIIVFQNVRGTFLSEGEYENLRPIRQGSVMIDEATDVYDTAEWILRNTTCNGSIGVKGTSYPGFYATWASICRHPAVKAVSPQAPVTDWYMGDDVHHNGAFFLSDMYRFGGSFFRPRKRPTIRSNRSLVEIDKNSYDFFLEKGSMAKLLEPYGDSLKFWNEIQAHPDYDSFWKIRNPLQHLKNVKPAVMVVAGTFDAEDCYGAFATYRGYKQNSPGSDIYMVIGPWAHGSWKDLKYSSLDGAIFGDGTAAHFIEKIEYPFFAYFLEGKGSKPKSEVDVLFSGETMPDRKRESWKKYDCWPPAGMETEKFYLHSDGVLSIDKPTEGNGLCKYVSDPENPVPYYHDREAFERIRDYMAGDQRFLEDRKDVLKFTGKKAEREMVLSGPVKVSLKASCTGTDADFVVKLIDVRPDGYQMLIRGDVMPGRYRKGFDKPVAMNHDAVETIEFTMPDIAHIIKPGHRLMVQVQSSWFPLVAMNPQKILENQYTATKDDYKVCEIGIYCNNDVCSYIELPIIKK